MVDHFFNSTKLDLMSACPFAPPELALKRPGSERSSFLITTCRILTSLTTKDPGLRSVAEEDHRTVSGLCCLARGNAKDVMSSSGNGPHRAANPSILEHHLDRGVGERVGFQPAR